MTDKLKPIANCRECPLSKQAFSKHDGWGPTCLLLDGRYEAARRWHEPCFDTLFRDDIRRRLIAFEKQTTLADAEQNQRAES